MENIDTNVLFKYYDVFQELRLYFVLCEHSKQFSQMSSLHQPHIPEASRLQKSNILERDVE